MPGIVVGRRDRPAGAGPPRSRRACATNFVLFGVERDRGAFLEALERRGVLMVEHAAHGADPRGDALRHRALATSSTTIAGRPRRHSHETAPAGPARRLAARCRPGARRARPADRATIASPRRRVARRRARLLDGGAVTDRVERTSRLTRPPPTPGPARRAAVRPRRGALPARRRATSRRSRRSRHPHQDDRLGDASRERYLGRTRPTRRAPRGSRGARSGRRCRRRPDSSGTSRSTTSAGALRHRVHRVWERRSTGDGRHRRRPLPAVRPRLRAARRAARLDHRAGSRRRRGYLDGASDPRRSCRQVRAVAGDRARIRPRAAALLRRDRRRPADERCSASRARAASSAPPNAPRSPSRTTATGSARTLAGGGRRVAARARAATTSSSRCARFDGLDADAILEIG